jgi:hypothetical protein
MCAAERETFSHIHKCCKVQQVFAHLARFVTRLGIPCNNSQSFICLGLIEGRPPPPGISALHMAIWKFVIIDFVAADVAGKDFTPDDVWKTALRRFRSRLMAHEERQARRMRAEKSRGRPLPSRASADKQVAPLVGYEIAAEGEVVAHYTPQLRYLFD